MTKVIRAIVSVMFFATAHCFGQSVLDALVVITSRVAGTDTWAMGTGVTISPDGDVLTAYHVVQGAKSILISYKDQTAFKVVQVSKWDTLRDLAVLHIAESHPQLPYLPLASDYAVANPGPAIVYGHSANFYFSQFPTSIIHTPIKSREVRDPDTNREVFALQDISLIPISLVGVYGGLSGGPLIVDGQVIGILSGSLNNGGSIAWAIPVSLLSLSSMRDVEKMPGSFTWPSLELMAKGSTYPRAEVSLGGNLARLFDNAGSALDTLGILLPKMESDCSVYRARFDRLFKDADAQLAVNPNESVDSFTSDPSVAETWRDFVAAAAGCFDSINKETQQQEITSTQIGEIPDAFKEYAGPLPDTAKNQEIDNRMAEQGEQNIRDQNAIQADNVKFQAAIAQLGPSPQSLAESRRFWIRSRDILDYVIPAGGKGIMRRNYELQKKMISQMELVFELERSSGN